MSYIEQYRKQYLDALNNYIRHPNRGVWSIACSTHVYASHEEYYDTADQKVPGKTGLTVKDAI